MTLVASDVFSSESSANSKFTGGASSDDRGGGQRGSDSSEASSDIMDMVIQTTSRRTTTTTSATGERSTAFLGDRSSVRQHMSSTRGSGGAIDSSLDFLLGIDDDDNESNGESNE
jgi:hypothetical protein